MKKKKHEHYMTFAANRAKKGILVFGTGPFGAVIVKNGAVIAEAHNEVTSTNDPTAHAEVVAIRRACRKLKTFQLKGCDIYCTSEPCPMCMGAIYWSRLRKVFYACTNKDAAKVGFDDAYIYKEMRKKPSKRKLKFKQIKCKDAELLLKMWDELDNKIRY